MKKAQEMACSHRKILSAYVVTQLALGIFEAVIVGEIICEAMAMGARLLAWSGLLYDLNKEVKYKEPSKAVLEEDEPDGKGAEV